LTDSLTHSLTATLVLLVEDEEHLAQGLLFNLEAEGYRTLHFADGAEALDFLLETDEPLGAILLDVMLPGKDGFEIVRTLRERRLYFPVLMLTARSNPGDILEGLNAGADDYLPKPFDLEMMLVRLKTLLRRAAWQRATPADPKPDPLPSKDVFTFAGREIHFDTLELTVPSRPTTHLTLMEADLLRFLTDRAGQIVPRKDLLEQVWRMKEDTDTRAVDNFIVRLRRYIEDDPADPRHLLTVRGIGYRFLPNP
jgi:DNA-binding response OmpR family regulator